MNECFDKSSVNEKQEFGKGRKPLSKWHADRLRILQEKDDFASFIQFIKWKKGNPPNENDINEIEYLDELTEEFRNLGGYKFFEKHGLDLPPCGIGGYEESY